MHISLEADYAIRIVQCLANEQIRLGAKAISEKTDVTERFTIKILHKLVNADILKSYKGVGGGYELAREPQNITLLQVLEVIEGPIVISRCNEEGHDCCEDCLCYFHHVFDEAAVEIAKRFSAVTFMPKNCNRGNRPNKKGSRT